MGSLEPVVDTDQLLDLIDLGISSYIVLNNNNHNQNIITGFSF